MPKRKRHEQTEVTTVGAKRLRPPRRSARLRDIEDKKVPDGEKAHQLPSPSTSASKKRRKNSIISRNVRCEAKDSLDPEKSKILPQITDQPREAASDPVACWALTSSWPQDFLYDNSKMSENPSNKRKSESSHRSDIVKRLADQGVFMQSSNLIRKESKTLCDSYLKIKWRNIRSSIFSGKEFARVLDRVQNLNEARIQRDITPWVVPSAEILYFRGEHNLNWIGEELDTEWIKCVAMGSTKPKPDYTAGLQRKAFTEEEIEKLENYATPIRPFYFTPNLCFPFLICEAKSGERGLNEADRQNIHSASIAVNAIVMLYKEAFMTTSPDRVQKLYGQVLVFTISHDNDRVFLYGHFTVVDDTGQLEFYRYPIALFSLTTKDGADRLKAYNFVRHVYEKFAPEHRQRIKDAVTYLASPPEHTGLSFAASDLSIDQVDSQQDSQEAPSQGDGAFKKPDAPSSASQKREMAKIREQMERQSNERSQQIDKLLQQMEQQRQQMEQQLERQRQDSKEQLERQREQMELQRQREERLEAKLEDQSKEIIRLLEKRTNDHL